MSNRSAFTLAEGATHVDTCDNVRKSAFTLAEVLITLAIIGVVAAMTIPTLVADYKEKATVSQLMNAYSSLSNAYQMMQAEYGVISTWGLPGTASVDENGDYIYDLSSNELISTRLQKYLKVSKVCQEDSTYVCLNRNFYNLNGKLLHTAGDVIDFSDTSAKTKFFLSDGTFVSFGWFSGISHVGSIWVALPDKDVISGKNRFYFEISDAGVRPLGSSVDTAKGTSHTFEYYCNPSNEIDNQGFGCTAWVIHNKNMDYLHCREKLSWDGAHSCKEAQ